MKKILFFFSIMIIWLSSSAQNYYQMGRLPLPAQDSDLVAIWRGNASGGPLKKLPLAYLKAYSGGGSVTSFSFTNGNGFTGVVTNPTTTPTLSLVLQNAAADGTTKGQATFTAADFNSSSGLISIDYTNGQAANGSTKGFLTSTDWNTFNSKPDNFIDLNDVPNSYTGAAGFVPTVLPGENGLAFVNLFNTDHSVKVDMVTTANITLSGIQNLDAQTGSAGKKVLVWQQTNPVENGVYDMASVAWTRDASSDQTAELNDQVVFAIYPHVVGVDLYGGSYFSQYIENPVVNTDPIKYQRGRTGGAAFWSINGNNVNSSNNTFGTLNNNAVKFNTNSIYRGEITAPGLFCWGSSDQFQINTSGRITKYNNATSTDGQLLIGGTSLGYWTAGTLGVTAPLSIANGNGTIGLSTSMSTGKLIGRSTAGTGVMEEITVGTGLSLSGGTLSATGVSEPSNQVVIGTGSGVDSYSDFTYNHSSGELIVNDANLGIPALDIVPWDGGPTSTPIIQMLSFNITSGFGSILSMGGSGGTSSSMTIGSSNANDGTMTATMQFVSQTSPEIDLSAGQYGFVTMTPDAFSIEPYGNTTMALRFYENTLNPPATNYVEFKAPASIASPVTWTLPDADGTQGAVMRTDGSGNLSFDQDLLVRADHVIEAPQIHNNGAGDDDASHPVLRSGTYTPTPSSSSNLDSDPTFYQCQWMRVGNVVTVSGRFDAKSTGTGSTSNFIFDAPIASTMSAETNAGGVASSTDTPSKVQQSASISSDNHGHFYVSWWPAGTDTDLWYFTVTYVVN